MARGSVFTSGGAIMAMNWDGTGRVTIHAGPARYPAWGRTCLLAVPPSTALPTDTDGDGICEDVNGNGAKDFNDIVLYFGQIKWIIANEPISAFDYNGNGRIDFADVVWLFNHL